MSPDSRRVIAFLGVVGCLVLAANPADAIPNKASPEEDVQRIAKLLKPIPDETWKTIAGARITEKYEIVKGDTLFGISKGLFGDGKYWPKIWALNNGAITNPHWIKPGNFVAFLPGTGSSLPAIAINGVAVTAENGAEVGTLSDAGPGGRIRSMDWKYLPPQGWESINIELPPDVDPQGFDMKNKNQILVKTGFELEAVASTDRIPFLGEITGANTEGEYLTIGNVIYITGEENLQVGTTYGVTTEPATITSLSSGRSGYAYQMLGRVKVTGVRDNLFTGVVLTNLHYLPRKSRLITLPARIKGIKAVAGTAPVEAALLLDPDISTTRTSQHKLVFLDRGTEDGIAPGMVFRAYQHYDPHTSKKITDSDLLSDADFMAVQVSQRFSAAIAIRGDTVVLENTRLVLLTDISDLARRKVTRRSDLEGKSPSELDELDKLDKGGLGKEEEKELKQLEKWKGNEEKPKAPTDEKGLPGAPPPSEDLTPVPGGPVNGDTNQPSRDKGAPPPPPALDAEPQAPETDSFPAKEGAPTAPIPGEGDLVPPKAETAPPPPPALDTSKTIENTVDQ